MRRSILLALMITACASVTGAVTQYQSVKAYHQREIEPTPLHYGVYLMMERCTGIERPFQDLRWFVADSLIAPQGRVWGIWTTEQKIVLDVQLVFMPGLVAHEVLHHLQQGEIPPEIEAKCRVDIGLNALRLIIG